MTSLANQALRRPTQIGKPGAAVLVRHPRHPYVAAAGAVLAVLAFVLLAWRP